MFLLMLVRVGTILMLLPGMNGRTAPTPVKVAFAVLLTIVLTPFTPRGDAELSQAGTFIVAVGQEFLVGLLMGFGVALILGAIEIASSLITIQMGLNLGPTFNPAFNMSGAPLDTLYMIIATLIFFGVNAHHTIILALQKSFVTLPVGTAGVSSGGADTIIDLASGMLVNALRIGLPVAGTLLLADLAMGLLSRMVPQMNVFFVGLPAKIMVGFALVLLTLPFLFNVIGSLMGAELIDVISRAGGVAR
jgi:flagellar biosynthetic protein FliR